jgi:seryl-tRNA synthetase
MSLETKVKKGQSFAKEILAKLKGDDPAALSEKIARKAISAVEGQLAALRAKEVDLENEVEDSLEALHNAKYPTTVFTNNQSYIQNIQSYKLRFDESSEKLQEVRKSIIYFESMLASF